VQIISKAEQTPVTSHAGDTVFCKGAAQQSPASYLTVRLARQDSSGWLLRSIMRKARQERIIYVIPYTDMNQTANLSNILEQKISSDHSNWTG